jgi:predicted ATPase/class 3 adenylate cyclase
LLFTDIEGSTALVRRLGDSYQSVLERHLAILRASIEAWEGVEESRQGDSLFVTFPSATGALEAALDAQRRLEAEPWPSGGRVRVRMGVHVGEVADSGAGLVGLAIHQAARIMTAAHGGQILVSRELVQQASRLPAEAKLLALGPYELRDIGCIELLQVEHPDLPDDFPAPRTRRAVAHNLPSPLTSLVGRDTEADAVSALLAHHRLVTLLGEGGRGKTRLSLLVARAELDRFIDGVWFVDLATLTPGADITARVVEVLGAHGRTDDLVATLAQLEVLLVLDNCEHVLESTATMLPRLLEGCPSIRVLATSRAALGVPGEVRYRVPPLELPRPGADAAEAAASAAVTLFTERAALARPHHRFDDREMAVVVELCRRLEGLPLAIELAAARFGALSLGELVGGIDDRFTMLTGGPRSAPERHQTLRNAVDWSFRLLDTDEQHVLRHLAAFRGGCDVEGATAVCGPVSSPGGVLDLLVRLVDQSLVTATDDDARTRYRVHELIREHALASVDDDEREAIEARHAEWCIELGSRLHLGPEPAGERAWLRRHDVERDNLRAAVDWLMARRPEAALRLLLDVQPGMDMTAQGRWCIDLVEVVLPRAAGAPAGDRADALALLAWMRSDLGFTDALGLCAEAMGLLDDVDDPAIECSVRASAVKCHADAYDGDIDANELAAALDAGDRAGGTYWPVMVRHVLSFKAPPPIAEALSSDALDIAEQLGMGLFAAMLRSNLACIAQFRGDSVTAFAMWHDVLSVLDDLADSEGDTACFYSLAEGEHRELAAGLHLAEDFVIRVTSAPHDPQLAAALYSVVAHLRRLAGDLEGAEVALEYVRRAGTEDFDFLGGLALITRSALLRARGQAPSAATVMEHTAGYVAFQGLTDIPMRVIEELAAVALALGRAGDAADLLATARAARERDHRPLSPACAREVDALSVLLGERQGRVLDTGAVIGLTHSLAAT